MLPCLCKGGVHLATHVLNTSTTACVGKWLLSPERAGRNAGPAAAELAAAELAATVSAWGSRSVPLSEAACSPAGALSCACSSSLASKAASASVTTLQTSQRRCVSSASALFGSDARFPPTEAENA